MSRATSPEIPAATRTWVLELLDLHERSLVAFATRITGDLERARDVVQETFLELLRAEHSAVEERARQWLFTVTRNRALDALRKEQPMQSHDPSAAPILDQRLTEEQGPAEAAQHADTLAQIQGLLTSLPENQREVLELKFHHGLSYSEIAGVTQHSIGHVGWLIHHGLKTLRRRLGVDQVSGAAEGLA